MSLVPPQISGINPCDSVTMAGNGDHRVTKDISARKTPSHNHGNIYAAVAAAANEAARETYQNSLIAGFEQKIYGMQAEHDNEKQNYEQKIHDMQVEFDKERQDVEKRIETAVQATKQQEEAARANTEAAARTANVQALAKLDEALAIKKEAAKVLREQSEEHDTRTAGLRAEHTTEVETLNRQIAGIKFSHASEVRGLKRQLKVEVNFVSGTLKKRTFYRHPGTVFETLVEDLLTDLRKHKPFLLRSGIDFRRCPIQHPGSIKYDWTLAKVS